MTQDTACSPIRVAIADDEPLARLRLMQLCAQLSSQCPNQVVAEYEHGQALVQALPHWGEKSDLCVDVLLLDINMPGLNGLEIAQYLHQHAPTVAVIFVTAQAEHAIQAFDLSATDYVLKPVRAERLLSALLKAKSLKDANKTIAPAKTDAVITVHPLNNASQTIVIPLSEVLWFKSEHKQTILRSETNYFTVSQSLAELEVWLPTLGEDYVRIHRNALARSQALGQIVTRAELQVQILNKIGQELERLPVSRRMLAGLQSLPAAQIKTRL